MSKYAHLARITDPAAQAAFKLLIDRVGKIETSTAAIGAVSKPLAENLDSNGKQIKAVADPSHEQDAVNLRTLRTYVDAIVHPAPARTFKVAPSAPDIPPVGPPAPPPAPIPVDFPPPQQGAGTIRCGGTAFHLVDGTIWPWRGATDFRLYKRYLDGENIAPILANRVNSGANTLRVLGAAFNLFSFDPPTIGDTYYNSLGAFADLLAASGLFLEFTALADAQLIASLTGTRAQIDHFSRVIAGFGSKGNVFLELVNEYPKNGVNPGAGFTYPPGILSSAGSSTTDDLPFQPPWDYATFHVARDSEWPRKSQALKDLRDGFGGFVGFKRPVIADEGMGAAEVDIAGSRSTSTDDFYWYGANAQMMGGGATFHSENGLQSLAYQPVQQACALSFFQGMIDVPPETQLWSYTRGGLVGPDVALNHVDLPDPSGALRTYEKFSGNTAVVIVIRPGPAWVAVPINGWVIDSQKGPRGTLIFLHR